MDLRRRLGALVGVGALTFGLAGVALAGNANLSPAAAPAAAAPQSCGVEPLDVEFVLDASGSMGSNSSGGHTRLYWAQAAANQLATALDNNGGVGSSGSHHVGLSHFNGSHSNPQNYVAVPGWIDLPLGGSNLAAFSAAVGTLSASGNTPLKQGMATGASDMTSGGRVGVQHIIIFLTDGRPNPDSSSTYNGTFAPSPNTTNQRPTATDAASFLASADIVYSIAVGTGGTGTSNVDTGLMQLLDKPNGHYYNVVSADDLPGLFGDIFTQIACPPHLTVEKLVDGEHSSSADPGDTLDYTIKVVNDGGSAASNVAVHDDISALLAHGSFDACDNGCSHDADSVDWLLASVPVGETDLHFSIDLDAVFPAGETDLPNKVLVEGSNCNVDLAGQDADCNTDTTVEAAPFVTVEKTVGGAHESSAQPGDTLDYAIVLSNSGNANASMNVFDNISALLAHGSLGPCDGCSGPASGVISWSGVAVAAGGSTELDFSITLAVDGWDVGTTNLPNTVVVPLTNCGEQPLPACQTVTHVSVEPGPPILSAEKAVDKDEAVPGDTLNYTITLSNSGGSDATGVAVNDDISALLAHGTFGTCDNACSNDADSVDWTGLTVAKGDSLELHFSIVLAADGWAVGDTQLPNTVVVDGTSCGANAEVKDPDCSTLTTVTHFEDNTGGASDLPTLPNTATPGSSGSSGPSDSSWLLVAAMGILLASVVVMTPARGKNRR